MASYQRDVAQRTAEYLRRVDVYGPALEAEDLEEATAILGSRPASWQEGDAALEQYVLEDPGKHDTELIALFYRRLSRLKAQLGPAGSAMARHLPIQPFGH